MGVAGRAPSEALGEGPSSLCQPPAAATLGASLGSQPPVQAPTLLSSRGQ